MHILPRRSPDSLLAVALLAGLLAAACSDPAEAPTTTPTPTTTATAAPTEPPTPTSTPTSTPTLSPVGSVREIDFSDPLVIGTLIDQAGGGEIQPSRVVYEDLTSDGVEEAVVIVESGGTMGDIGFGVYTLNDGVPELAFFESVSGRVEVRVGVIVAVEGVFAPRDAECCPSQLREVTYRWDGSGFSRVSEQVIDNPA